MNIIYGILLCGLIGAAASGIGLILPLGTVTISLILGMIFANIFKVPSRFAKGITFTEKKILATAISLMGFSLDYNILFSLGTFPLVLILSGVPVTILTAVLLGRLLKVDRDLALLVGTGNSICGSSAIAATQGVINTKEEHVGVSVAVINFLGTLGILFLPMLISLFPNLSEQTAGMAIGNTLQAVGQVTAAGFSMGNLTGQNAVLVKMGRVLLLSPVVVIFGLLQKGKGISMDSAPKGIPGIPPFILLFLLFSLVNTTGVIPPIVLEYLNTFKNLLLITAMAGIGMKISFKGLIKEGQKALLLGFLSWFVQISFTFLLLLIFV